MSNDPHSPNTTEQELAERLQREWRRIFDAIGHPTVVLDPGHGIIAANRAVQRASGKSEYELLGSKCYEVFHGPQAAGPGQGCPMETMLASGRLEAIDMEMEAFGGRYMISCTPVLDEAGRLEKIIHIAAEITARKQTEDSLRLSEARYRELVDHMSSGVAVYEAVDDGADFVFRDFNEAGERIDRTNRADVIGRRVTEAFPGVKEFGLLDVFQHVWRTGTPEHFPVALYKDERIAGWRDNFVYKLPSGEVVAIYDDVTERKQAEERLEHLNAVLRAVRNVSQLITRETDRERLLGGVCDNLVMTRGYLAAWAVLLDEAGGVWLASGRGLGESFDALVERAKSEAPPTCFRTTLEQPGVHVLAPPHEACRDCPMTGIWSASSVVTTRLIHGSRIYGILAVCMPPDYASDTEEQGLFTEVANDIAYALQQIELSEERQRTEQALRDSEEKYRALFETMAEGVVYQDTDGNIISANPAAERILGLSAVDLLGRTSDDERWQSVRADGSLFPGDDHPSMVALRTGEPVRNVIMGVFNPVDETRHWILVNAVPEFRPGETVPYRAYTTFADITDLRQATAALHESEARLKSIFRVAPIGIGVVSNRVLLDVNDRFCEMLGYARDELIGQNARIVYPTDEDYEFVGRVKYGQIRERGTGTVETRFRRKDGTIIDVILGSTPLDPDDLSLGVTFTALDITDRKRAEQALRESEATYRALVEQSLQGILVLQGVPPRVAFANPAAARAYGTTAQELMSLEPGGADRFLHPDDRDAVLARYHARLAGEPAGTRYESRIVRADGSVRWLDFSASRVDYGGQPASQMAFVDITERKQAEEALRESERVLAEAQRVAHLGCWEWDIGNDVIRWSEEERRIFGVDPRGPDLRIDEALALVHPDDLEHARESMRKGLSGEAPYEFTTRIIRPDGAVRTIETYAEVRRGERGEARRVVGTTLDVTERRQAEEAVRRSQTFLDTVIEHSPYAMWVSDSQGTLIRTNQALRDMFHISDEALVGKYNIFRDNIVEEQGAMPLVRQVFDEGATVRFMLEYESAQLRGIDITEPVSVILDVTVSPILSADGRVAHAIIQHIDISDRIRAEQGLARQAEELARSNAELQQFAYVASHDLQEPLRKVTSYLQLLEERYKGRLDAGADEFIGFAVDGAQRMKRLINDLLEYSRVGTRGTPFEATDIDALLEHVLRDLQVTLTESLAHVSHDPLPTVMADSVQLGQVFQNMIANAVKFRGNEPPRIHVWAERRDQEWLFCVRDNGIGIDPRFAERVFVMFQRLHGRGKYAGTGIGLAICKKIIERHGGRIWVESVPNQGSTFCFTLPAIEGERS